MKKFEADGISFNWTERGEGTPFVFQHGLGGDLNQPLGLMAPDAPFRLLSFDFRGHGNTVGGMTDLSFSVFAGDLLAFLDHLSIERAVIGGVSMGAGVALNFAVRYRERVLGLVLSRPAWISDPLPPNMRAYPEIARLIRENGARRGKELFKEASFYREALRVSPDSCRSLMSQFDRPLAETCVDVLECLPADSPVRSREAIERLDVPALVAGNRQDPVHPFEYAEELARLIPGARLAELTPKSVSESSHRLDFQRCIAEFMAELQGR